MSRYRIDASNKKTIIRTLDAVSIDYNGRMSSKLYAVTITSRKKYNDIYQFRNELYQFLSDIGYDFAVKGFMEFHCQKGRQDKVHGHGVVFSGQPPTGNKSNPFHFKICKLDDPDVWDGYCKKEILRTLEINHDIKTGMFNYHKKPIFLFTESE